MLGATAGACFLGIALLGPLRERLIPFLVLFALAFGTYLVAVWLVLRQPGLASGRRLWPLLGLALIYRLILLPVAPTLSDDLYRYVWEGRVLLAGVSPYREPPSSPALAALRDDAIWPYVNNPDVPSPYPPLAQVAGAAGAALTPHSTLGVKLVFTLADVATIAALLALLWATGRPLGRVLVYAWHPLPIIAFSHSGHNDALMVALLTLGLALVARHRRWLPALCLALAALSKVTPLLLFPLLPRKIGTAPAVLAGAIVLAAWVPFLVLGAGAPGSLVTYLGEWKDNDSLHAVLHALIGPPGAKAVSLALLLAGVGALAFHPSLSRRPLWWQAYVALGLSILVASSVHSWYLTWLLPPLALTLHVGPRWGRPDPADAATPVPPRSLWLGPPAAVGWLLFSGLVALPYLTYDTLWWHLGLSLAEYLPLFALLVTHLALHLTHRQERRQEAVPRAEIGHA